MAGMTSRRLIVPLEQMPQQVFEMTAESMFLTEPPGR